MVSHPGSGGAFENEVCVMVNVLGLLGLKKTCALHSSSEQEQIKNCEPIPLISFISHLLLL